MEALAAVGLASNIFQFLEFAGKLISGGIAIYQSVDGSTPVNAQLEKLTKSLETSCSQVRLSLLQSTESYGVVQVADECRELASELLETFRSLKSSSKGKKLQSAFLSISNIWKENKIKDYRLRLQEYRSQLTLQLLLILRDENLKTFELSEQQHALFQAQNALRFDQLRSEIIKQLEDLKRSGLAASNLFENLNILAESKIDAEKGDAILSSLAYLDMNSRRSRIPEAHRNTFNWIFEKTHPDGRAGPNFIDWLERESGIFWVTGKAGAGKSTLMKMLVEHSATQEALEIWAKHSRLITASHFFWNPGSDLQKSQEGLFRSLLYYIVAMVPSLTAKLFPTRWQLLENAQRGATPLLPISSQPWTRAELLDALSCLGDQETPDARFCFFIDGLDEYDGDKAELASVITTMAANRNVKLCVSSRPWSDFYDAFGGNMKRRLALHDLTRDDIAQYVRAKFEEHPRFADLKARDSRYEEFVHEVVDLSKGVFLWVHLVVLLLRNCFTNMDSISVLRKRLRMLPTRLEDFYEYMLNSIDHFYHRDTARILQCCLVSRVPLPLVVASVFNGGPDASCTARRDGSTDSYLPNICAVAQRRVKARCGDILDVGEDLLTCEPEYEHIVSPWFAIEFIHRTVKEYLTSPKTTAKLNGWLGGTFCVHRYLCNAWVSATEVLDRHDMFLPSTLRDCVVPSIAYHASLAESTEGKNLTPLLSRFCLLFLDGCIVDPENSVHVPTAMLLGAIHFGAWIYVTDRVSLDNRWAISVGGVPTLELVLKTKFSDEFPFAKTRAAHRTYEDLDPDIIDFLVASGADPNVRTALDGSTCKGCPGHTACAKVLRHMSELWRSGAYSDSSVADKQHRQRLVKALLRGGAGHTLLQEARECPAHVQPDSWLFMLDIEHGEKAFAAILRDAVFAHQACGAPERGADEQLEERAGVGLWQWATSKVAEVALATIDYAERKDWL